MKAAARVRRAVGLSVALLLSVVAAAAQASTCETLASLELKDTKIDAAEVVAAGAYKPAKPFFIPMPAP